jgi:hypothetical protein
MPEGIEDRNADVWEPLLAVADAAGGHWPRTARVAAVALVALLREANPSLGVKLLADLRQIWTGDAMATAAILPKLHALPESPWSDIRGKPLDDRGLARRLRAYDIKSRTVRISDATPRGYAREDLWDAWSRYLPPLPEAQQAQHPPQSGTFAAT